MPGSLHPAYWRSQQKGGRNEPAGACRLRHVHSRGDVPASLSSLSLAVPERIRTNLNAWMVAGRGR